MDAMMQGYYVSLPATEVKFFKELVHKMGWTMQRSKSIDHVTVKEEMMKGLPADVRSLIGVASSITDEDIATDDRLAYLLGK